MDPIALSFDYRLEDWSALQKAAQARAARAGSYWHRLAYRLPMFVLLCGLIVAFTAYRDDQARNALLLGAVGTILVVFAQSALAMRRLRPRRDGQFLGRAQIEIGPRGLEYHRPGVEALVHWSQAQSVETTPAHLFLWVDASQGYVVPARVLPASLTVAALAGHMRALIAAADGTPQFEMQEDQLLRVVPAPDQHDAAGTRGPEPGAWRELASIGRLLLILPVNGAAIAGRDVTIILMGVILLAFWIPLDLLVFPDATEFNWYALPSLAWVIAGVLALAWLLSRLATPQVPYRRTLLLATGALPIAIAGSTVHALAGYQAGYVIGLMMWMWSTVYFGRGMRAVSGGNQMRAYFVVLVATACFIAAGDYLYVNPSFWAYADDEEESAPDAPDADARTWARMEELQFGQQARLDEELARIEALPRKHGAMYFVGFAGYGEQRVFAEEIDLAEKQVAALYGSAERSIELVNDQRDPEKLPLASAPALRYTLQSLGSMMAPDDVLFLALSSHGSEDGSISVSNAGRAPADLGAVELAGMLREAKIPWKVVVVSACYAGGFIDALRDDHTIVLAAAAQDRTSFGCADDRDLTYFGEAFYRDALPKSASLRAAFENARQAIAAREKQEGVEASDPQAYFGRLIEQKLVLR